ncbi:MAG: hypothetical protein ACI956_001213, partial [Nonlabens sp.]
MKQQAHLTHLYWRAGFGLSPKEWETRKNWSIDKAVSSLFKEAEQAAPLDDTIARSIMSEEEAKKKNPKKRSELRKKARALVFQQNMDWVHRMASTESSSLLEKMCLFWHGHFACTTKNPKLVQLQLETIRTHALGNFREFVQAMSKDVSMIRFLNNQQNKKNSPNENFAREVMELFTIGRGHYTEQDVKEAARAFTGWRSNGRGEFVFKERYHDNGQKSFMKTSGNLNGDDIVNALLDQKQTALFITTKIYRYFVNEKVDEKRVAQLADFFYTSGYDIKKIMKFIFTSDWFYDSKNKGVKIKSPVELIAGVLRQLQAEMNEKKSFKFIQKALGQRLFDPPNVAGWPGGKSWIDNSTLMLRLNLVNYLYKKTDVNFKVKDELETQRKGQAFKKINGHIDFRDLLKTFGKGKQEDIFEDLSIFLLQTNKRPEKSVIDPFIVKANNEDYVKSLALRLMTLPEYQM